MGFLKTLKAKYSFESKKKLKKNSYISIYSLFPGCMVGNNHKETLFSLRIYGL